MHHAMYLWKPEQRLPCTSFTGGQGGLETPRSHASNALNLAKNASQPCHTAKIPNISKLAQMHSTSCDYMWHHIERTPESATPRGRHPRLRQVQRPHTARAWGQVVFSSGSSKGDIVVRKGVGELRGRRASGQLRAPRVSDLAVVTI